MKRTQFIIAGRHPLLLLVRDHLIRSGFELTSVDSLDSTKAAFVVFGAEVYSAAEYVKVYEDLDIHKIKCPALVLSSSSVYGDRDHGLSLRDVLPMDEAHGSVITSPLDPGSIRPLSALLIEHTFLHRAAKTIIARPFNIYGPNVKHGVVNKFVESCLEGKPLTVHSPGRQTRTFLYEDDFLRAIDGLVHKLLKGGRGIYNIGSDERVEILSLAKSVGHAFQTTPSIELTEAVDRHVWWKLPALERIKADAKFKPTTSLRSGLFRMANDLGSSLGSVVGSPRILLPDSEIAKIQELASNPPQPSPNLSVAAKRYAHR
jgi:dTDP-D-glucose 4,6-dehydratase